MFLRPKGLRLFCAFLLVFVFFWNCNTYALNRPSVKNAKVSAFVVKVYDGDTVLVALEGGLYKRVRYLLIDTPELHHPKRGEEEYGVKAYLYNKELVENKRVKLEFDVQKTDKYGRLLCYVYVKHKGKWICINEKLLSEGYAMLYTLAPNVKYVDYFRLLFERAVKNKKGFWSLALNRIYDAFEVDKNRFALKGHFLTVELKVAKIKKLKRFTLLRAENSSFSVVIYKDSLKEFEKRGIIPANLIGKRIRVIGKLVLYKGIYPEIVAVDPIQIKVLSNH